MRLGKLVKGTANAVLVNLVDRSIQSIELDSRKVRPSTLFAVVPGRHSDGRQFVPDATAIRPNSFAPLGSRARTARRPSRP